MNDELFERVLIQLQPELAQEFGSAVLDDKKKLKALEIIKEKRVCIATLKDSSSVEEYNDIICYHKVHSMSFEKPIPLTQEEYDLLKEVLE